MKERWRKEMKEMEKRNEREIQQKEMKERWRKEMKERDGEKK